MGVIILTRDSSPFLIGDYIVMYKKIDCDLSNKDVTYILLGSLTVKEIKEWLPYVKGRLVVETQKNITIPKEIQDSIIEDKSMTNTKSNYRWVKALLNWSDRNRVHKVMEGVPIPLAIAFVKANNEDIDLYRRLSKTYKHLSHDYTTAILSYGIKGESKTINYPKKIKGESNTPVIFRTNEKHWEDLVRHDPVVANLIRSIDKDTLPKGVKRTKEKVVEWL